MTPRTESQPKDWPHAPIHRISETDVYIVTAGTYHKQDFFKGDERLALLESALLRLAEHYGWQLEAWAVFANHYHFVAQSPENAGTLRQFLRHLHGDTARAVNQLDTSPGRQVWQNFWDTRLTFEHSYLARLNYVHQNPVRHGFVAVANQYPWCSAAWFERVTPAAMVKTIYGLKIDQVKVPDDF
jgi:putative transposase